LVFTQNKPTECILVAIRSQAHQNPMQYDQQGQWVQYQNRPPYERWSFWNTGFL